MIRLQLSFYVVSRGITIQNNMGGCQNSGPFLDPYSTTAPIFRVPQKGSQFGQPPIWMRFRPPEGVGFAQKDPLG